MIQSSEFINRVIAFPGFDISWAGPNPLGSKGYCLGSFDGEVIITDEKGTLAVNKFEIQSSEPINAVAGVGSYIAACSRADIMILQLRVNDPDVMSATINYGSHGVVASNRRLFVAASGIHGNILIDPVDAGYVLIPYEDNGDVLGYCYRTIVVGEVGSEVFVSAMFRGGIGKTKYMPDKNLRHRNVTKWKNHKIVDVCAIGSGNSRAVAAISRDGVLMLYHDILDRDPLPYKYPDFKGVIYRVLSGCGHIVVLGSEAFYVFLNFADRFLEQSKDSFARVRTYTQPVKAVDANIVGDELVVVTEDGVAVCFDLKKIERGYPSESVHNTPSDQIEMDRPEFSEWSQENNFAEPELLFSEISSRSESLPLPGGV